ncbi:MAG: 30S ribosomal protein S20 [Candidatus Taylorbacteria bacterium CG10_big_fil_rev_8_21_14_0_10_41_48]|uniref:Small ribosomal subunit protein bS20 n=1 Tax=Candidatus Taylorbacteria bacterium CG10_big_fil_rev_8_21_14_0_10_41_48 TaxID=1975024 RepID=A0A2M8LD77_9BACT|nr:MAG: 30S ribosomal protein S20 [Candidatus Taylorbacteria bacterium CG10_big_fil_rev_8_21_14_0_10_41_48]
MPITSSAKKALRASKKKRVYNVRHRDAVLSVTKEIKKLVSSKKAKDAMKLLPKAYAELDKAAKTGFIKKNTADRKKSRLSAFLKKSV